MDSKNLQYSKQSSNKFIIRPVDTVTKCINRLDIIILFTHFRTKNYGNRTAVGLVAALKTLPANGSEFDA